MRDVSLCLCGAAVAGNLLFGVMRNAKRERVLSVLIVLNLCALIAIVLHLLGEVLL